MLKEILTGSHWRQSQITILGTLINGILGAVFYISAARILGPSDFGLLIVSIITLTLIADVSDLGTNTGLIRFVSASLRFEKDKVFKYLKLSLEIKILIWVIVLIAGLSLAPYIATEIFQKSQLTDPLKIVMFGVGGALLFSYATSALQAFQHFSNWSIINISTNLVRIIIILILLISNFISLEGVLLSYVLVPFMGFALALFLLPTKRIIYSSGEFKLLKGFVRYNLWIALITLIYSFSMRVDTFLSARLLTAFEVGIYSAANQLLALVPQIISAIGVVAAPKFSSISSKSEMIIYLKKLQSMVLILGLVGIIFIPSAYYIFPLVYGPDYISAIPIFIILSLAMLIYLISVPIHSAIYYYYGKPQVFVFVASGHLLITLFLGYNLISYQGIYGAALTVLIGMVFNFLAPLGWFLVRISKANGK